MSTADKNSMKIKLLIIILLSNLTIEPRNPRSRRTHNTVSKTVASHSAIDKPQKKYITITPFTARLEGVECGLCAQAAKKTLANFSEITEVQIALVNEDSEFATVQFVLNAQPDLIDVASINQALDKEGFEMTDVQAQKSIVTIAS